MTAPVLATDCFCIRPFKLQDLACFAGYRANPEVAEYQSWQTYSYEDALALFHSMDYSNFGSPGYWYQLAISSEEVLFGDLALHFIDEDQVEIGFTISPEFQQQGIAFQAVKRLLHYLFKELNKHRVIAITDVRNIASSRLLEKLGFRREGHFIKNVYFKGQWGDEYQYALLSSEFNG